jgi:hypothetical protein
LLSQRRERKARRRLLIRAAVCLLLGAVAVAATAAAVDRWREVRRAREERAQAASHTAPVNPAPSPVTNRPGPDPNSDRTEPRAPTKFDRIEPKPPAESPAPTTDVELKPGAPPPAVAPPPTKVPTAEKPANPPAVADPARPAGQPAPVSNPTPTPKPPFKSDRPAKEAFPGYYLRTTAKFKVFVSRLAYENSDEAEGEPLKGIDEELTRIAELFPEISLKALRTVPIWVEWDHVIPRSVRAFAVYYGKTGHELWTEGVDPRKAGCVVVLSLKTAHNLRAKWGKRQNVLLHELAHAIHDKAFGFANPLIKNAYEQAVARALYAKVKHDDGSAREAYANTNRAEYFAELTCAYLDRLDYYPHDAKELKEHDSVGYELMTKAYGTPEQIAVAKKKEAGQKKNAGKK